MGAIFKKEFKNYFLSPIGYIVIGVFLLTFSVFFATGVFLYGSIDLGGLYYNTAVWGLIIITPILTMRMFSEERKAGTEQLLLTSPTGMMSVIFGKLLAAMSVMGITLLISMVYHIIVSFIGEPNIWQTISAIFGFILISFATVSFGMFASSLTENQIISGMTTIAFLVLSLFVVDLIPVLSSFKLSSFFLGFAQGHIQIESIISLLLFSFMFISFTAIVMQRRKLVK